jgi:hypothetical protein
MKVQFYTLFTRRIGFRQVRERFSSTFLVGGPKWCKFEFLARKSDVFPRLTPWTISYQRIYRKFELGVEITGLQCREVLHRGKGQRRPIIVRRHDITFI